MFLTMLDTNIVGHLLRRHPGVVHRVVTAPRNSLCVSAITAGELLFGVANRPEATSLALAVREFLRRVDVLEWDHAVAARYGVLRAALRASGRTLGPLDQLIAAHAISADLILVTNDQGFRQIRDLRLEDWTA
jgi:tRNA(fMet)-specific endonuclease VapC